MLPSPPANSRWSKLAVHCGEDRFVAGIERKTVKQHVQAVSLVEFDDAVEAAGYRALSRRGIIDEEYFS